MEAGLRFDSLVRSSITTQSKAMQKRVDSYNSIIPTMSWSSVSHYNGTMPTDRATSSSSSSSNGIRIDIVGGNPIPTLIAQGNVNSNVNNNNNINGRMSMESVSSLSSSHSILPYSTMLEGATNNITMTRYGDNNNTVASCESETPKQPLPPRHRSVSVSGIKSAFIPPPPPPSYSASPSLMMSTPSFASRALQPIENRMAGGPPGQVNDSAAGAGAAPDGFDFLKSPTTLTFERMIEASELIDENPALMKKVKGGSSKKSKSKTAKPTSLLGDTNMDSDNSDVDADFADDPIEEIQADDDLHRRVVLLMALQRQPAEPKQPDQFVEAKAHRDPSSLVIREGFFWREYPVCEQVLYDAMAEYYQLSCLQRQSKLQQEFNNALVERMRTVAHEARYVFEPTFSDKKLRDRIRCFFKTHQQNAKKRLVTLIKHADSVEHISALRFMIQCVRQGRSLDEMQALEDLPRKIRGKERPPLTTTPVSRLVLKA